MQVVAEACRALCALAAGSADAAVMAAGVTARHLAALREYRCAGVHAGTVAAKRCGRWALYARRARAPPYPNAACTPSAPASLAKALCRRAPARAYGVREGRGSTMQHVTAGTAQTGAIGMTASWTISRLCTRGTWQTLSAWPVARWTLISASFAQCTVHIWCRIWAGLLTLGMCLASASARDEVSRRQTGPRNRSGLRATVIWGGPAGTCSSWGACCATARTSWRPRRPRARPACAPRSAWSSCCTFSAARRVRAACPQRHERGCCTARNSF